VNATSSQWVQLNAENSLCYTDNGNLTLRIHAGEPSSVHNSQISEVVRWWMGYLTSVSYRASWQGNHIVEVYTNITGDNQQSFDFQLTNVPYGNHTLEVYVSYVVYTFGTQRTPVTFSRNYNLYNFTVESTPTSGHTIVGLSLEQIAIVFLIAMFSCCCGNRIF
jgi:hypothetical protein